MASLKNSLIIALCALCLSAHAAFAQQEQSAPPVQAKITLQIQWANLPPIYFNIKDSTATKNSPSSAMWAGRFNRIASWQPPAGSLPVTAVNFLGRIEGDGVRLNVSVLLGKFHDQQKAVGSYLIHENEKVQITELANFGVEPPEVTLLKVAQIIASPPNVVNKSPSLVVLNVEAFDSFSPYRLTLKNASTHDIIAINIRTLRDNRVLLTGLPHGDRAHPLIKSGATYTTNVISGSSGRATPFDYQPTLAPTIEIAGVVFDDETYEGAPTVAAQVIGWHRGSEKQLRRVITLLQNALDDTSTNESVLLNRLKSQIAALDETPDPALMNELLAQFPNLPSKDIVKSAVQFTLHKTKMDALNDLARFERERAKNPNVSFRDWLARAKENFLNQLSAVAKSAS